MHRSPALHEDGRSSVAMPPATPADLVRPLRALAAVACLLLLLAQATAATAADLAGRVVGIADGDTLTLLTEAKEAVRIRLAEIDAPEHGQPWGARAKQALSDLAFGRQVRVAAVDIDRYDRVVGRVRAGTLDVNAEMVRRGAAWIYPKYSRDPTLPPLEAEARGARRGRGARAAAVPGGAGGWGAGRRGQ